MRPLSHLMATTLTILIYAAFLYPKLKTKKDALGKKYFEDL